eukprot:m51a1_g3128 hypothetical protein (109) ;mRNA; f:248782-249253
MFESYGHSSIEPTSPSEATPMREFIFECAKTSSRLHLGGSVVLVMNIRGADGSVAARLQSVPFSLLSKPPKTRRGSKSKGIPAALHDQQDEVSMEVLQSDEDGSDELT